MTEEQLIKIYNSILEENHELTDILVKQNLVSKTRSLELVYEYGISKENEENFIEKFKIYKERNKDYYIVSMKEIKNFKKLEKLMYTIMNRIHVILLNLFQLFHNIKI